MKRRNFLKAAAAMPIAAIPGACTAPVRVSNDFEESVRNASGYVFSRNQRSALVPTGFPALSSLIRSFRNQQLTVIAARPCMGKTAFVSAIACNAAITCNLPVAFFSIQTPALYLTKRMLGSLTNTRSFASEADGTSAKDQERLIDAGMVLHNAPLFIDGSPVLTMNQLRSRSHRLKQQYGLALVILDSLEGLLIRERTPHPADLLNAKLRALKSLAIEIDAPILAIAPVSRSVLSRSNNRPYLSDLEHFSEYANEPIDLMISLYRDEIYTQHSPDEGIMEVIVDKHRHGNTGNARLQFKWESLSFSPLAQF